MEIERGREKKQGEERGEVNWEGTWEDGDNGERERRKRGGEMETGNCQARGKTGRHGWGSEEARGADEDEGRR